LGLGDLDSRQSPERVGAEEVFGSRVLMVALGDKHTVTVCEDGCMWTAGCGNNGAVGLNNRKNYMVPTKVHAEYFGNAKIVTAAAGFAHSVAITEKGALYTWGKGEDASHSGCTGGLGHYRSSNTHFNASDKLVPTLIAPAFLAGARVGRCHSLLPLDIVLAFVMGTHARLGSAMQAATSAGGGSKRGGVLQEVGAYDRKGCAYVTMPADLLQRVVEACMSWPEGRAGELQGIVQLLGGGVMEEGGGSTIIAIHISSTT